MIHLLLKLILMAILHAFKAWRFCIKNFYQENTMSCLIPVITSWNFMGYSIFGIILEKIMMEKCTWNRFSRCNDTQGWFLGDEKERCAVSPTKNMTILQPKIKVVWDTWHLSIFMLIKVHNNQNTFTLLEFSNFKYLAGKNLFLKLFGKVTIIKAPAGFKLMTYRLLLYALSLCATLFFSFILIRCTSKYEGVTGVPYHLNKFFPLHPRSSIWFLSDQELQTCNYCTYMYILNLPGTYNHSHSQAYI